MPVYQGRRSCYALNEGMYVKRIGRKGIDTVYEAIAILYLILRDKKRGWTYEQGTCKRIVMSEQLFKQRVSFVPQLAKFHNAPREVREKIEQIANYVLKNRKLPSYIVWKGRRISVDDIVKKMIARVKKQKKSTKKSKERRLF